MHKVTGSILSTVQNLGFVVPYIILILGSGTRGWGETEDQRFNLSYTEAQGQPQLHDLGLGSRMADTHIASCIQEAKEDLRMRPI